MILLQRLHRRHCIARGRLRRVAQQRKERILFIGIVPRASSAEIGEARLHRLLVFNTQRTVTSSLLDFPQRSKKRLDPAVAIAEQSDRLIESVFSDDSKGDGHDRSIRLSNARRQFDNCPRAYRILRRPQLDSGPGYWLSTLALFGD